MCFFKKYRIKRLTKKLTQLQQHRLSHQVNNTAVQKEIRIYHKLNRLYTKSYGSKHYPFALEMAKECLRISAQLEDFEAQYLLGKRAVDEGKWRETLVREKLFASNANEALMKEAYETGLTYLASAAKASHILAMRYYGLCFIFGWGVAQDKDKGFSMVVESIAKENSWSKAHQIFAQLGLNKPEFFEAFLKQQAKHQQ